MDTEGKCVGCGVAECLKEPRKNSIESSKKTQETKKVRGGGGTYDVFKSGYTNKEFANQHQEEDFTFVNIDEEENEDSKMSAFLCVLSLLMLGTTFSLWVAGFPITCDLCN